MTGQVSPSTGRPCASPGSAEPGVWRGHPCTPPRRARTTLSQSRDSSRASWACIAHELKTSIQPTAFIWNPVNLTRRPRTAAHKNAERAPIS